MKLTENHKQVLREYLKAQQGDAEAQYRLGFRYFKGHGVRPDYQKAFQWYLKAAQQGYAEAQYHLGSMYHDGIQGIPSSYKRALKWFLKAAQQEQAKAQLILAIFYEEGTRAPRIKLTEIHPEALKWYSSAFKQYSNSQSRDVEALKWHLKWYLKEATQRGDEVIVKVQCYLGDIHYFNDNYREAFQWYLKAAQQEHLLDSMDLFTMYHHLGMMYEIKTNMVNRLRNFSLKLTIIPLHPLNHYIPQFLTV